MDFTDRKGHGEHNFIATSDQFQSSRRPLVKTGHTTCIEDMRCHQMSVPVMPFNKKIYDQNTNFSCDTADDQQHEEDLI